jgi:hypothetical protein
MKKGRKAVARGQCRPFVMEEDITAVADYSTLLCLLTAAPDSEGCLNEMNRLLWQMAAILEWKILCLP